jgi:hypothetical protein
MNGDKIIGFDEFWTFALKAGQGHGADPVLDAHAYLSDHKVVAVLEAMTAALMVAKPDDPKAFLAEKLTALKAGLYECNPYIAPCSPVALKAPGFNPCR